ncbi:Pinin/SDK/MemA protein [Phaffia rhodozyma]|uniref:Pinin/SDK/MemA protein n=1 Tax=Phaffia rhodozyma TaxID=264483 RepID=A0A0F7SIL7_PHARH|nr:Pinin/SDK/MemA protein [Phaffia rhodozyma]
MAGTVQAPSTDITQSSLDPTSQPSTLTSTEQAADTEITSPAATATTVPPVKPNSPIKQTEAEKREERRKKGLGADEKKRGKRLFGGLLGTLDAFKKEERKRDASDAAKRRELITNRIQTKLRSENTISEELATKERSARTLRLEAERKEFEVKLKSGSLATRHRSLLRLSSFLLTTSSAPTQSVSPDTDASLSPSTSHLSSLFPISSQSSGILKPRPEVTLPALFYSPAKLTDEQQTKVNRQLEEVENLVKREKTAWVEERSALEDRVVEARNEEGELMKSIEDLRRQRQGLDRESSNTQSTTALNRSSVPASATTTGTQLEKSIGLEGEDQEMKGVDESRTGTVTGSAAPTASTGMDVEGDEALEY